jgi:hypothetical protein
MDMVTYSNIFRSKWFWEKIESYGAKHVLTIQTDTVLLNGSCIERFLEYDYVGAPWYAGAGFAQTLGTGRVGNGGMSIRNVQTMIYINQTYHLTNTSLPGLEIEDMYFASSLMKEMNISKSSNGTLGRKINIPDVEIAQEFSVETVYSQTSCGIHKPLLRFLSPPYQASETYLYALLNYTYQDRNTYLGEYIEDQDKYLSHKLK